MKNQERNPGRVLVVSCGNVGSVALHKMAEVPDIFSEIHVVSRTEKNAKKVQASVFQRHGVRIILHQTDFSDEKRILELFEIVKPALVINLGPPYWNLKIMNACIEMKTNYLDTACYEDPHFYGFSNMKQLLMKRSFERVGSIAQLQCGFDPGVTNLFVAYVLQKGILDQIDSLDILDCNGGTKNVEWAPNFDPEINIRELIMTVRAVHSGRWTKHGKIIDQDAVCFNFNFPEAGAADAYLMYHEEIESLKDKMKIRRIRFWMTFSKKYLTFLRVLHTVGMTRIDPVIYEGQPIIPVKFLKELLPKGEDFNASYIGKTNIGCIMKGPKDGKERAFYVYQICDHQEAFRETDGNAIGYTTAVPAVVGAEMIIKKEWSRPGVFVPEEREAEVFLKRLAERGLPWQMEELPDLPEFLKQDFPEKK